MGDITITAEKGRLSEDEIERMVREAEEFADEDAKLRENVEARNQFEAYAYQLRGSLDGVARRTHIPGAAEGGERRAAESAGGGREPDPPEGVPVIAIGGDGRRRHSTA